MKIKERVKIDKYQDLPRQLEKQWIIKMPVKPIRDRALGTTVRKGRVDRRRELKIRIRIDNIPTTAMLNSARILRRIMLSVSLYRGIFPTFIFTL